MKESFGHGGGNRMKQPGGPTRSLNNVVVGQWGQGTPAALPTV